jgi:hypothetical protein
MKKAILGLILILTWASPQALGAQPAMLAELPLTLSSALASAKSQGRLGATASPHNIVFTWTASTSTYTGLGYNIYLGSTSGGESATPSNTTLLTTACSGTSCTATIGVTGASGDAGTSALIVPLATVYADLEACVPNGSTTTCSVATTEVSCTIPLASSDINPPGSVAAVAH